MWVKVSDGWVNLAYVAIVGVVEDGFILRFGALGESIRATLGEDVRAVAEALHEIEKNQNRGKGGRDGRDVARHARTEP
jgi:hypothetical protein